MARYGPNMGGNDPDALDSTQGHMVPKVAGMAQNRPKSPQYSPYKGFLGLALAKWSQGSHIAYIQGKSIG